MSRGTAPNLILIDQIKKVFVNYPQFATMTFMDYMKIHMPMSIMVSMIVFAYFALRLCPPKNSKKTELLTQHVNSDAPVKTSFQEEYDKLGPWCGGEIVTIVMFIGGCM